eukprot:GGOE01049607.1.p1 GENE.GGOE01049607.1~~GGOE01049607.1.p1  ORF type:complete len:624 (+),score=118.18 GGOE01049607.1:117-1874(+)
MADHSGSVPVDILLRCNRLRALGSIAEDIADATERSSCLVLAPDRQSVRRSIPFQPKEERYYMERTVYVEGLPADCTHSSLEALFQQWGEVTYVQLPRNREDDSLKGFAFVEFAEAGHVQRAVAQLSPAPADPFPVWDSARGLVDLMNAAGVARPTMRVLAKADWLRLHRQYKAAHDKLAALISRANPSEKSVVKASGVIAKVLGVQFDEGRLQVVVHGADHQKAINSMAMSSTVERAINACSAPDVVPCEGSTADPPVEASPSLPSAGTTVAASQTRVAVADAAVPPEGKQNQSSSRALRLTRAERKRQLLEMFREYGIIFVDHSVQAASKPNSTEGSTATPTQDVYHLRFGTHDGALQACTAALERLLAESFAILEGNEERQYWAHIAEQRQSRRASRPSKRQKTDRKKWACGAPDGTGQKKRAGRRSAQKPNAGASEADAACAPNGMPDGPRSGAGYHFSCKGMPQRKAGQRSVPAQKRQHVTFGSDDEEASEPAAADPTSTTSERVASGVVPDAPSEESDSDTDTDSNDGCSTSSDSSDDAVPSAMAADHPPPAPPPPLDPSEGGQPSPEVPPTPLGTADL